MSEQPDLATEVVTQLENVRRSQRMSRETLSKLTGWSEGTLRNMVKSPSTARLSQIMAVAEVLGTPLVFEIDGERV